MLRLALTLGVGELLELLLGHRQHRLRGALQLRLGAFVSTSEDVSELEVLKETFS